MKILLHICCSNCAVYPFKMLKEDGHDYSGFWFNPNIHPYEEYSLRLDSLKKLAGRWLINMNYSDEYTPEEYFRVFGIESLNSFSGINDHIESPERCKSCYELRLGKTAEEAQKQGFDAFSTTLLISPYQDFGQIVATGEELAEKHNLQFFNKDFRPYFKNSQAMAKELGLYRQKYCGCIFSLNERAKKLKSKITAEVIK